MAANLQAPSAPTRLWSTPELTTSCALLGPMKGSGYRTPPLLVRRPDGQVSQVTPLLYAVLSAVDGHRTWDAVAQEVARSTGRPISEQDVQYLALTRLIPAGLLKPVDPKQAAASVQRPLLGLTGRVVVSSPRVTDAIVRPLTWLFNPVVVTTVIVAFVVSTWWVLTREGMVAAISAVMDSPAMVVGVVVGTLLSAAFHELGHSAAVRYGGAAPGVMGAALYLVWPVFYTDVTDSYRLSKAGRLRVDLGGLYFNAVFSLGVVVAWWFTDARALLVLVGAQLLQMARQMIPIVRFDGYHILADLTGVPDLFARIRPTLLALVGRGDGSQRLLKPWVRVVVVGWVLVVVPSLVGLLILAVRGLPEILAESARGATGHIDAFGRAVDTGAWAAGALSAIATLTTVLVPIGLLYMLFRLTRSVGTGLWTASDGHPAIRGAAAVVALVLLTTTTGTYLPRPRALSPMLAAAAPVPSKRPAPEAPSTSRAVPTPTVTQRASTDSVPSRVGLTNQLVRSAERLQDRRPVSAVPPVPSAAVLYAQVDDWPFPFDPPADARPGDTVVVAVNTTDNTSVFAYAAALEIVDGDTVDTINAAYALNSCVDCTSRAVAFSVVLGVGDVEVVVPQNLAVAYNQDCDGCRSEAVAIQLMVTLQQPPSDELMAAIEAVWAQLEEVSTSFDTAPVEEVYGVLDTTRAGILALVEASQAATVSGPDPTDTDSSDLETTQDPATAEDEAGFAAAGEPGAGRPIGRLAPPVGSEPITDVLAAEGMVDPPEAVLTAAESAASAQPVGRLSPALDQPTTDSDTPVSGAPASGAPDTSAPASTSPASSAAESSAVESSAAGSTPADLEVVAPVPPGDTAAVATGIPAPTPSAAPETASDDDAEVPRPVPPAPAPTPEPIRTAVRRPPVRRRPVRHQPARRRQARCRLGPSRVRGPVDQGDRYAVPDVQSGHVGHQ